MAGGERGPTVASTLLDILKRNGIRHIFGLPAAQMALVMDGASRDGFFRYATTRHEEAAGHMAHAVHLVSGETAVCFGTTGPGATNLLPGVAAAWEDNIPMVVITPDNQLNRLEPFRDVLQMADQIALYASITKWQATVRDPARLGEIVERAIHMARSGRPGPVQINLPCDVHSWPCPGPRETRPVAPPPRPVPSGRDLERIVELLADARRPLLYAGGGVARSGGVQAFRALAGLTGMAATTSAKGSGVVDTHGEGFFGSCGWLGGDGVLKACAEADLIIAVGTKFSTWTPIGKPPQHPVPEGQRIVQIDIDPAMLGKNCPVDLGLVGDARETLLALAEHLQDREWQYDTRWTASLRDAWRRQTAEANAMADAETTPGTDLLNCAAVCREIMRKAPRDAILCIDGGQVAHWANFYARPLDPQHITFNGGMGHMGNGIPQAIGAQIAAPGKQVIAITGDGAAGCTIQELETARRMKLPLTIVIFNDSHWGCYRPMSDNVFHNEDLGTRLTDVDFVEVARGFGCGGERVTKISELAPALERALAAKEPTVIDVIGDFTPCPTDRGWPWTHEGVTLVSQ